MTNMYFDTYMFFNRSEGPNILHFISDGRFWSFTKKTDLLRNSFYALTLHSTLRLDSVYGIKKPESNDSGFLCSEGPTRTDDLRVMSPTSYQLLHLALYSIDTRMFECGAKIRLFYCFQTKSPNNFNFFLLNKGISAFFYL